MTHLQEVLLMMAKDFDEFCQTYNIKYYIDGGTALGAIRHKGFIPWDDDYDVIMLPEDYDRFVKLYKANKDSSKYNFYEAEKDWPMHVSKIKLKGTDIEELDQYPMDDHGIYIDIFRFDYASNSGLIRYIQWIFTRLWVTLMLAQKPYTANSSMKKNLLWLAKRINNKYLRNIARNLGRSKKPTDYLSMAWCRTRKSINQYFCKRELFDYSINVDFETIKLPITKEYDKYLKICFGNYMELPPIEKRTGLHIKSVNYGKY